MPEKDPTTVVLLTYLWVLLVSIWGGVVTHIQKLKQGKIPRFSIAELLGDLTTSGFAGLITFFLCESAAIEPMLAAALIGISGHMGTRSIAMIEQVLQKRFINK